MDIKLETTTIPDNNNDKNNLEIEHTDSNYNDKTSLSNGNAAKNLKCPKCNWHYKYKETLEAHLREKHGGDSDFITNKAKSNCNFCQMNLAHPKLSRGESYPCGYKPYRCAICNYSTTSKGNLTIHMQSDKHMNNVRTQAMLGVLTKNQEKQEFEAEIENEEISNGNEELPGNKILQSLIQKLGEKTEESTPSVKIPEKITPTTPSPVNALLLQQLLKQSQDQKLMNAIQAMNALNQQQQQAAVAVAAVNNNNNNSDIQTNNFIRAVEDDSGSKRGTIWHCDLCNYKTEYASNLRIHSKSDKHRLAVAHKTGNLEGIANLTASMNHHHHHNFQQNLVNQQNFLPNFKKQLNTSSFNPPSHHNSIHSTTALPDNNNHHLQLVKCPLCPTTFSSSPNNLLVQEHLIVHHKVQPECVKSVMSLIQPVNVENSSNNNTPKPQVNSETAGKIEENNNNASDNKINNTSPNRESSPNSHSISNSPPNSSNNQSENSSQSPTNIDLVRDIVEATTKKNDENEKVTVKTEPSVNVPITNGLLEELKQRLAQSSNSTPDPPAVKTESNLPDLCKSFKKFL